jgi:hypothetical protein
MLSSPVKVTASFGSTDTELVMATAAGLPAAAVDFSRGSAGVIVWSVPAAQFAWQQQHV